MIETFVKLPTGDIEIGHIREMYIDLNFTRFEFMDWKRRPALIQKSGKIKHLYTGQSFDSNNFNLVADGWTNDDCQICFKNISDNENEYTFTSGYFNGGEWVCKSCYETILLAKDIDKKLAELDQYQK